MSKYDFLTIGGATEDITFNTNEGKLVSDEEIPGQKLLAFRYGSKIKIEEAHSSFGGGAANSAVNFARLGLKTASIVVVGKDNRGKRILQNLRSQGVNTRWTQKKDRESGFSFLLVGPGNEHIVFSNRAANRELRLTDHYRTPLMGTDWVYLTSLSGEWQAVLKKLFSLPDLKIAWNPGHVQLKSGINKLSRYLKKTKILFVNREEAIELLLTKKKYKDKPDSFFKNIKNILKALKETGPEMVVVTRGKKGANAYDGDKFYYQKKVAEKKKVDTTGVGDAFNSSLVAGLKLYDGDIQKAMQLGARNAASVIEKEGAQNGLLTSQAVKK